MNTIEHCPVFGLYKAERILVRQYSALLKEMDLTYTQYIVILVLAHKPDISVDELGKELLLDSGTLTPLLKRLEKKELLTRQQSLQDERKKILSLTPKGLSLAETFACVQQTMQRQFQITKEEKDSLILTLKKILKAST